MTRKVGPLMTYEQAKVISLSFSLCSLLFFFSYLIFIFN